MTLSKFIEEVTMGFFRLDPKTIKKKELLSAQLSLLESQSALEFSQAMVEYNTARIKRLKASILSDDNEDSISEKAITPLVLPTTL